MTSKTETTSIPEIDFDSWTPEQEEAALKQIAQAAKCKYAIGDNHFYGRFPDGTIINLPLSISLEDVNEISEGDVASVDQFTRLIEKIAGKEDAEKFLAQPTPSMIDMANKYFEIFQNSTSSCWKIIALARLHHEHRQPFAATLRERYGISANQIGKTITYGEAWDLVYQLLDDPSNPLCAEIAQWSYPARLIDLLQLAATIGDGKAAEKSCHGPWHDAKNKSTPRKPHQRKSTRRSPSWTRKSSSPTSKQHRRGSHHGENRRNRRRPRVPGHDWIQKSVSQEMSGSGSQGAKKFTDSLKGMGSKAGKQLGKEFGTTAKDAMKNVGGDEMKQLSKDVASAAAAVSKARIKQQTATASAIQAENTYNAAVKKYGADSTQAAAAEQRLAAARERVKLADIELTAATGNLKSAQEALTTAQNPPKHKRKRSPKATRASSPNSKPDSRTSTPARPPPHHCPPRSAPSQEPSPVRPSTRSTNSAPAGPTPTWPCSTARDGSAKSAEPPEQSQMASAR